jgi:hypothetical protein
MVGGCLQDVLPSNLRSKEKKYHFLQFPIFEAGSLVVDGKGLRPFLTVDVAVAVEPLPYHYRYTYFFDFPKDGWG